MSENTKQPVEEFGPRSSIGALIKLTAEPYEISTVTMVQQRAHEIWQERVERGIDGMAEGDWEAAERELSLGQPREDPGEIPHKEVPFDAHWEQRQELT